MKRLCAVLLLATTFGCAAAPPADAPEAAMTWPTDLSAREGQTVTLVGTARLAKTGPLLVADDDRTIYIADFEDWPADWSGRRVQVTGTVVARHDLPVFVRIEGTPQIAGIPVPKGTDLKAASKRLLLRDVALTPAP